MKQRISRARAADVLPYFEAARRAGATKLRELAAAITARRTGASRTWQPMLIKRVADAKRV